MEAEADVFRLMNFDRIDGLPVIKNNNEMALREMCKHAIEVHGKKDICILTGPKGNEVAEERLSVCLDEIGKAGLRVSEEHIVYGDFWYSSGDALAFRHMMRQTLFQHRRQWTI